MPGRFFVGGNALGRPHAGGHAWALAQWAIGLHRAGHEVAFFDRGPRPDGEGVTQLLSATGVEFEVLPEKSEPGEVRRRADLLLNVMGFAPTDLARDSGAVFLDIDPGYAQIWRELGLADVFDGHDQFVTIGENIGTSACSIPLCGLDWVTTPPPVVLGEWPVAAGGSAFTSIASWRNPYGTVAWDGQTLGSRVHEFRKFFELPRLVDAEFQLALDIDGAEVDDLRRLEANGWRLVDPHAVAGTPADYRSYIQRSRAEFAVAQNMYVATHSGWLSDRTLCYLASGKPVLAQDTGFSDNYPVGSGLLAFSTLEGAAAGVEDIQSNYDRHSRAAREIAEEYFDSSKVLGRLLERLGTGDGAPA